jgi:hypothetical protein
MRRVRSTELTSVRDTLAARIERDDLMPDNALAFPDFRKSGRRQARRPQHSGPRPGRLRLLLPGTPLDGRDEWHTDIGYVFQDRNG